MSAPQHDGEQGLIALFTATPQLGDLEEARSFIKAIRSKRNMCALGSRDWHVEQIKLDWWLTRLLDELECPA